MPGNPEECRQHALVCARLAQTSATQKARNHFAKLVRTRMMLAYELEKSPTVLNEDDDAESDKRSGSN